VGLAAPKDRTVFTTSGLTPPQAPRAPRFIFGSAFGLFFGSFSGSVFGLFSGSVFGLFVGVVFGLLFGLPGAIDARARWSAFRWPDLRSHRANLVSGLSTGSVLGLIVGLSAVPILGWSGGLLFGLSLGLVLGLVLGLNRSSEVVGQVSIDTGLRLSRRSFLRSLLVLGLSTGLVFGLVFGLPHGLARGLVFGSVFGLVFGLLFGLSRGGWYLVLQGLLRRRLRRLGLFPNRGRVEPFFGLMCDVGLLRRVAGGGSVRFAHDLLRDHLAGLSPTASQPVAQLSGLVEPLSP
jgi:hypothetical protein